MAPGIEELIRMSREGKGQRVGRRREVENTQQQFMNFRLKSAVHGRQERSMVAMVTNNA